jgi:hypothetical protein
MKPALLLLAAATVGATGCASNDLSLSIVQMEAITPATMCVAMAATGTGTVGRDRGLLDVSLVTTSGYIGVPVVQNDLPSNVNGVEFNAIQVIGANVALTDAAGATLTLPSGQSSFFYAAAPGRLLPGTTVPMFVEILPRDAALALAGMVPAGGIFTVIAKVQPVGKHSNDQVVGGAVSYPIDLCNGCLVETSTCPLPKGTMATTPCFPQQDDATLCCTDAASNATLCGGAAPVAM